MRRLLPPILFLLTLALPAVAWGRPVPSLVAPSVQARSPAVLRDARLLTSVQANGSARVIVGMRMPFQPESELDDLQEMQQQRAAIAQTRAALLKRLAAYNIQNITPFTYIPYIAMVVDETALVALRADPAISSISEDSAATLQLASSGPLIGAPQAWDAGFSGSDWTIAVLDSGVDSSHPFLSNKVLEEACYSTNDALRQLTSLCPNGLQQQIGPGAAVNCDLATCGHGTHVAGIAAGRGTSFSGIARDSTIIAIQVFSRVDDTQECARRGEAAPCIAAYDADVIRAMERVYELRSSYNIAAVNLSLGVNSYRSPAECDTDKPAYKSMIDTLRAAGIATIAASGNQSTTDALPAPACISSAISVGATDLEDQVISFSNSASFLDLLAPGLQVNSSLPGGIFDTLSGTSMATPHVSGAWAVLKSETPAASIDELLARLKTTGKPVIDTRNGITTARVQLDAALLAETAPAPPANLQATSELTTPVDLDWQDRSFNEQSFRIERRSGDEAWQLVGTVAAGATSYTDATTLCGTTYDYRVFAVNGVGDSRPGDTISVTAGASLVCQGVALTSPTDQYIQAGFAGSTITHTLHLENTGYVTDSFALSHTQPLWTTTLDAEATPALAAGASSDLSVAVSIPASPAAEFDVIDLRATSQSSATVSDTVTLISRVFGVDLDTLTSSGSSGATVEYPIKITNTGSTAATFAVRVAGFTWPTTLTAATGLAQAPAVSTTLPPGADDTIIVRVAIPADARQGESDTTAVVLSLEGVPGQSQTLELTTSVGQTPASIYLPLIRR